MFAKSKQIGLVSLFFVVAAALGGCAESVSNEPASFPSQERPVAFLSRNVTSAQLVGLEEERSVTTSEHAPSPAATVDVKHTSRVAGIR